MRRIILFILLINSFGVMSATNDKVLFVLTSNSQLGDTGKTTGFYLSELTHPYYIIKDAGYDIDVVSIKGGMAPIDPNSIDENDEDNQRFLKDAALMRKVITTKKISDANYKDYQAIVFAGGHGTMWDFPNNEDVKSLIKNIYENNGVVASICHGPSALVNVKLSNGKYIVDGKKIAVFTNIEERIAGLTNEVPFLLQSTLIKQGGIDESGMIPWTEHAVADQRLVTGQNPRSAHKFGKLIVEELKKLN